MKQLTLITTILIAFIFSVNIVNAQENELENVKIGVRLGANYSKVSGINSKYKLGVNFDAFTEITLSNNFKIQSELGFARQGFKPKTSNSKSVNLNYITFSPVIAKLYLNEKFNVEAGPKLGYLVGSKGINKKNLNKFDYGVTAGFSYAISKKFITVARYNLGLRNLSKQKGSKFKNRGFQLGFAFVF